ncbi:MAG: DUF4386 domain-containing protein [Anaerolineales bacterium]|nr:MAG: DUF4386 domain-containing protein [Anaerolineales bacterium]
MNLDKDTPRLLGAAFLLQAVASAVAGLILLGPLMVPGNIVASMTNMANNALQMRASIVVEMITAIGIVMLGALLFVTLQKQNGKIALVALGLYLIEAAILAVSRMAAFALLLVSQESVVAGHPPYLQSLGSLFYETQSFGYDLHMLPFALGATMFYYLLFKSGFIPRLLSLWGLIAAPLALIGILFSLLGYQVPIIVFIPNLPFELGIGVWLIVKGIRDASETG